MSKQRIKEICRKFQRDTKKIVDESNGITGINIKVGGKKYIIAEKKAEDKDNE